MKTSHSHPGLGSLLAVACSLVASRGLGDNAAYPAAVGGDAPLAYYRFQDSPVRNNLNVNSGSLGAAGNATNIVTVASSVVDPNLANNTVTNVTAIVSTIVPTVPPHVSSFSLTGGNLVISATNGVNGGTYYLLGTTNAALPLNQWKALATNVITAGSGAATFTFTGTNVISAGLKQQFYILSSTNN